MTGSARRSRGRPIRPRRPWGIWTMTLVGAAMVLTVLTVSGLVNATVGNDAHARPSEGHETVPAAVSAGGPIIDARATPVTSTRLPERTIALTFDDGPDPTWTPEILGVLAPHHVPGPFFVVGSMVARHPETARLILEPSSEGRLVVDLPTTSRLTALAHQLMTEGA